MIAFNGSNLSVVIQGPIESSRYYAGRTWTQACVESVRRFFPAAEIVLSTWQNSDVRELTWDVLVLSDDPGGIAPAVSELCPWEEWRKRPNNVARQIVSTRNGLRKCSRPFAFKIRTDFVLTGNNSATLELEESRFSSRSSSLKVFSRRIFAPTYGWYARHKSLFHPSDLAQLGATRDLEDLWDLDWETARAEADYFARNLPPHGCYDPWWLCRFLPDQFVWVNCLRKHFTIPFAHRWDDTTESRRVSDFSIVNNFHLFSLSAMGLKWLKQPSRIQIPAYGTELDWYYLYRDLMEGKEAPLLRFYCQDGLRRFQLCLEKAEYWGERIQSFFGVDGRRVIDGSVS